MLIKLADGSIAEERAPKTKAEIERLVVAELQTVLECENALRVVVMPVVDQSDIVSWAISSFDSGKSDGWACDNALQRIVPRFQRIYALVQKH